MELRIGLFSIFIAGVTSSMSSFEELMQVAADVSTGVLQAKFKSQNWHILHSDIQRYSELINNTMGYESASMQVFGKIVESITASAYETLFEYLALPDLDKLHLAQLDPLVHLYWTYLSSEYTTLQHSFIIAELISSSFSGTMEDYESEDLATISFALPVKGRSEFVMHVAKSVPPTNADVPPSPMTDDSNQVDVIAAMIYRLSQHMKSGSESRVHLASWFNAALYVYDSTVSPGDEPSMGHPLTQLCLEESELINHLVYDLRGAHTVRQRVALERFCLESLSLKVRFMSLFLPHIKQSFMVSRYLRGQTRIVLGSYNIESNLIAISQLSREELLAGDIVVEYKWLVFGFERNMTMDEEQWLDDLIPRIFSDRDWFDRNSLPRPDVPRPFLFVAVGKLIGLGLLRERLSIKLDRSILQRLLTKSDDELVDAEETSTSINALVHGIFSIVPRDAFSRFFDNGLELGKMFSGDLYDEGERGSL